MSDLLTMPDVVQRIGVPIGTLRYWRAQGSGPKSFRVGRRVMYRAADIDSWLEQQYRASTAGAA